ncbi:MAG: sigma-70 family RNA polymerase sigma factor [Bacteroidetes bacterium]|nr:MAG: sigma-70 family RNA polymerase sigma factor [Bacteroidota bacterium]
MNPLRRTLSEAEMLEEWKEIQAAQADPRAFRPLYDRYYEMLFRFIHRRTADEQLSADLTAQVFLKALQHLDGYAYRGVPFSAWLLRIASNEVAQHYRRSQKRRVVCLEESGVGEMMEEIDESFLEPYRRVLIQCLDQLRPRDLEILELRFFEQRPFKDVAQILGITESNAKMRTYRVLERLKKKLEKAAHHKGTPES